MYFSIKGKIIYVSKDFIVLETNGVGYQVFVSHPSEYFLGDEYKIFIQQIVKEDEQYLIGFSSLEEKKAFKLLLSVKGIGPKTAILILSKTSGNELINAIASNNMIFLRKLPGVGERGAAQILLDLRGKFENASTVSIRQYDEVKMALKNLKYKSKEIDDVLSKINLPNATNEILLKEALKRLGNKNG